MRRIRLRRPSPAMVVATIALIVALGGNALAGPMAQLAKLVSGDKLVKKHSLSGNRLRNRTLTGTQINLSKLGTVPNANHANNAGFATSAGSANTATTANTANTAATLTPGPGFTALTLTSGWKNNAFTAPVGFYKDREGFVHLRGAVDKTSGGNPIATLPAGARPGPGNDFFPVGRDGGQVGELQVTSTGDLNDISAGGPTFISLEGVTFFAGG